MSSWEIVIIVAVSAAGAICQGSLGIGLGLVAGPALLWIDPAFGPGPLLFAGQVVGGRHILAERGDLNWLALRHLLYGLPAGLVIGLTVLELVSKSTLSILIGASVAVASAALLAGLQIRRTPSSEIVGGAVTTFASVTAALPGPPLVVTFCEMRPAEFRATASAFIALVAASALVTLTATGNFGGDEVVLLAWMLPGIAMGLGGRFTRPLLDGRPYFRPLILMIALVAGIALVLRQLTSG